jgi:hypothetical protein
LEYGRDDAGGETLADELGGWNEEDEEEYDEEEDMDEEEEYLESETPQSSIPERDSGIDIASPPGVNGKRRKHSGLGIHESEEESADKDDESDDVDAEELRLVTANLEARLAAIESLAERGTGDRQNTMRDAGESDRCQDVISRTTESLKDLGAQSGIESGVTRCVIITRINAEC